MVTLQSLRSRLAHQLKRPSRMGIKALPLSTLLFVFVITCLNWKVYKKHHSKASAVFFLEDQSQHITIPSSLSQSNLPLYNKELASHAIRTTAWICGDKNDIDLLTNHQRPFFAFVHIYKTAGSTLRTFFATYANLCRKSLMIVINCTAAKSPLLKPKAGENWNNCRLKAVVDARRRTMEGYHRKHRIYPTVNNTVLQQNFDIFAGHYRIGMTDNIFPQHHSSSNDEDAHLHTPVRHIVFLRQPMERFVSSILYQAKKFSVNKKETVEDTAKYIKKRVHESRKENEYHTNISNYLLTPEQAQTKKEFPRSEQLVEYKTQLAIQNLIHYDAIVGMTERFSESMIILQHVLLPDRFTSDGREDRMGKMFDEYTANIDDESSKNESEISSTRQNPSQMGAISTSSVMAELKKDDIFMGEFKEYLKYEQLIVDFALRMHNMQHALVVEAEKREEESTVI